jgi:hypothetical protein
LHKIFTLNGDVDFDDRSPECVKAGLSLTRHAQHAVGGKDENCEAAK